VDKFFITGNQTDGSLNSPEPPIFVRLEFSSCPAEMQARHGTKSTRDSQLNLTRFRLVLRSLGRLVLQIAADLSTSQIGSAMVAADRQLLCWRKGRHLAVHNAHSWSVWSAETVKN